MLFILPTLFLASQITKTAGLPLLYRRAEPANNIDLTGVFGKAIKVSGGGVQTDTLYPKGLAGSLEVEYTDKVANTLTVTENKSPAPPPPGFLAIEKSSYIIALNGSVANATLQSVDFIFDANSTAAKTMDLTKAKTGKLCKDGKGFEVDDSLGELEFEADENELKLVVNGSMGGEWGIFIPTSAVKGGAANGTKPEEGEPANKKDLVGVFGQAIEVSGKGVQTDTLYPKGVAGSLEVEYTDQTANTLTVTENKSPAPPPVGFVAVEPSSYIIALKSGVANATLQSVDYIFDVNSTTAKSMDITKAKTGRLCTEANVFIIDEALGELEFEADENELKLVVTGSMVGEWAVFIPTSAVKAGAANSTKLEEGEIANKKDLVGVFGKAIEVSGKGVQTDTLYPKGVAGSLEVEYTDQTANTLTVTENKSPASPPAGFVAIEPSSYIIALKGDVANATLQSVDYIFDVNSTVAKTMDITKAKTGKLGQDGKSFVIDNALGELEFEADENELKLVVTGSMVGEWGIFIPVNTTKAKKNEVELANGPFNSLYVVPGGNVELELSFNSTGPAGALEIEYQSANSNGITVTPNFNPSGSLPEGFLFVDTTTYQIAVANATSPSDALRIDYKFSSAVKASADVSKGVIAKLQNNKFVTTGFGQLEWEKDEEEWSLTVHDLNGEWAILIPSTAQR